MRDIKVIVYDPENVHVSEDILGYVGENLATTLDVTLPSDWSGYFYIDWKIGGEWIVSETAYTSPDFTYDVPGEILVRGDVFMRIRVEQDDRVLMTELVKFAVR